MSQALERIRRAAREQRFAVTPKVGAVCGKAARTVLCGGRSAISVPTATAQQKGVMRPDGPPYSVRLAHPFQAKATLSRTRVPKRSEERATALPPSAR